MTDSSAAIPYDPTRDGRTDVGPKRTSSDKIHTILADALAEGPAARPGTLEVALALGAVEEDARAGRAVLVAGLDAGGFRLDGEGTRELRVSQKLTK